LIRDAASSLRSRWVRLPGAGWVLSAFVLSRLAAFAAGVRFDARALDIYWQVIDPELLLHDLGRSLFYLHSQPPLYNLFLGLVVKLAPGAPAPLFAALFLALGLALHLALLALLLRLGVPRAWAVVVTVAFLVNPGVLLTESWLSSAQPLTTMLVFAALFLHRFLERGRGIDAFAVGALLAAIALTHSAFHLVWCAGAALLLLISAPRALRLRAAALGIGMLLLVGTVYFKNWRLYGTPVASSWSGMSVAKLVLGRVPRPRLRALVAEGTLSPVVLVRPFSPLDAYPPAWTEVETPDVPVLRQRLKSNGERNLHHFAFLGISRQYLADAWRFFRLEPETYARNVAIAVAIFSIPSSYNVFFDDNRSRIAVWDRFYNRWLLGAAESWFGRDFRPSVPGSPHVRTESAFLWMLLFGFGAVEGARRGVAEFRAGGARRARGATLLFMAATVVYLSVLVNLVESGENNRMRSMVDPFAIALVAAALADRLRLRPGSTLATPAELPPGRRPG
jgi:hypothetical protein